MKKKLGICLCIAFILLGCSKALNRGTVTLDIHGEGMLTTERFQFRGGTPLTLLQKHHNITTSLNNNVVECIDQLCSSPKEWWKPTNRNQTILQGVKRYQLQDNDRIQFSLTNIQNEK